MRSIGSIGTAALGLAVFLTGCDWLGVSDPLDPWADQGIIGDPDVMPDILPDDSSTVDDPGQEGPEDVPLEPDDASMPEVGEDPCKGISSVGCCDGSVLHWCDASGELKQIDCGSMSDPNDKCGWYPSTKKYVCTDSDGEEPTGTFPRACP